MVPTRRSCPPRASHALLFAACLLAGPCAQAAGGADALRAEYEKRQDALAHSPLQQPLVVESSAAGSGLSGEVHAVLEHPFEVVAATLRQPDNWCDVLTLQTNVKRCVAESTPSALRVSVVRRSDQPLNDAYELTFRYATQGESGRFLSTRLSAEEGPLGTRDYRLSFEAIPLDAARSFVRISYSYTSGMAARLATQAYLASAGRDKVGFTVTGRNDQGAPTYVGGLQGVAERNTMRYFLAIESTLKAGKLPAAERREFRLHDFHTGVEQHARQLHEMTLDEYLVLKRREPGSER